MSAAEPTFLTRTASDQELEAARAVLWVTSQERPLSMPEAVVKGLVEAEQRRRASLLAERFGRWPRADALGVVALLAAGVWVPGPDDPVCEPGQTSQVDHCAQGMLPEERIGRQIDGPDGGTWTVVGIDEAGDPILAPDEPVTVVGPADLPPVLAETGTDAQGWLLGVSLVLGGTALVLVARAGRGWGAPRIDLEDDVIDQVLDDWRAGGQR